MHVPDSIRECVGFISRRKGGDDEDHFLGTCFFVAIGVAENQNYLVAVTAKHVIEQAASKYTTSVYIRVNEKDGLSCLHETNEADWKFHPDPRCDVAVAMLNLEDVDSRFDARGFSTSMFLTRDASVRKQVGVGDECFSVGLFVQHSGSSRNLPVVRMGNIAAMPEEDVRTKNYNYAAYLIDCRSIGGQSGSPVYVFVDPHVDSDLATTEKRLIRLVQPGKRDAKSFQLMGLIHGHWDLEEYDLTSQKIESLRLNMGIAIVVPATAILDALTHNFAEASFELMRQKVRESSDQLGGIRFIWWRWGRPDLMCIEMLTRASGDKLEEIEIEEIHDSLQETLSLSVRDTMEAEFFSSIRQFQYAEVDDESGGVLCSIPLTDCEMTSVLGEVRIHVHKTHLAAAIERMKEMLYSGLIRARWPE